LKNAFTSRLDFFQYDNKQINMNFDLFVILPFDLVAIIFEFRFILILRSFNYLLIFLNAVVTSMKNQCRLDSLLRSVKIVS